jgi:hypothetical protein
VTKIVWDNAVLISRATAARLGFVNSDLVDVQVGKLSFVGQFGFSRVSPTMQLGCHLAMAAASLVGWGRGQASMPIRCEQVTVQVSGWEGGWWPPVSAIRFRVPRVIGRWRAGLLFVRQI